MSGGEDPLLTYCQIERGIWIAIKSVESPK